jgi:Flp pilus assembly protein TadG
MNRPMGLSARCKRLQHRKSDAGSGGGISLMMAIFIIALIMVLGLVIDGSAKAKALDRANQLASEAARAGLQAASPQGVDAGAVDAAVGAYLHAQGVSDFTSVVGNQQVVVTVTITQPTKMLSAIGIDSTTVTGRGTANFVFGYGQ